MDAVYRISDATPIELYKDAAHDTCIGEAGLSQTRASFAKDAADRFVSFVSSAEKVVYCNRAVFWTETHFGRLSRGKTERSPVQEKKSSPLERILIESDPNKHLDSQLQIAVSSRIRLPSILPFASRLMLWIQMSG